MGDLLYTVFTNISPEVEEEFNLWQETEHGPYLLTLPGYQSVIRYKDWDVPHRYANFWHVSSMADFENPERLVRANTPWGKYLSPFRDRRIDFYLQDGGLEQVPPSAELDPRFTVLVMESYTDCDDASCGITAYYRKKLEGIRAVPGVLDVRIFHAYEGRGVEENCVFYYLSGPVKQVDGEIMPRIAAQLAGKCLPVRRSKLICVSQNCVVKTVSPVSLQAQVMNDEKERQ